MCFVFVFCICVCDVVLCGIADAYEKRAEVQADEASESEESDDEAAYAAEKAQQPRATQTIEAEIFKIYLPNGSYKSVKVTTTDTADNVCETLADKLTLPRSFGKYFVMWERVKERGTTDPPPPPPLNTTITITITITIASNIKIRSLLTSSWLAAHLV